MADHIPFIYGNEDCDLVNNVYGDSELVRVPLDRIDRLLPRLSEKPLWIDTAFEGFHHEISARSDDWKNYINQFPRAQRFDDDEFLAKPDVPDVQLFVNSILDKAAVAHPVWLSIPQFPVHRSKSRNKINWSLVETACKWREQRRFKGKLVLPLVLTHQDQLKGKSARSKHVEFVRKCLARAGQHIDCFWSVDSSLSDQTGVDNFRSVRFPSLVCFFSEMESILPKSLLKVAGPYWGMNLVLWARASIDYPAISVGRSYQYRILGINPKPSNVRLPLSPLRRWVGVSSGLNAWLKHVVAVLPPNDPAHIEFSKLLKNYAVICNDPLARKAVTRFYKWWFDSIAAHPKAGRALALYQDLSSAYVLGKTLTDLPKTEGSAKNPARIAEQLMANCL